MIEIIVLNHMAGRLTASVYMEYPADPPGRFVVLKRTGNGRENRIESSIIVADSYAESLLETAKLNEQVKAALDDLVDLNEICSSERGGDYPLTDEKNKRYRYQAVYNITHY